MPGPLRDAIERRSVRVVAYLDELPRWVPFTLIMLLLLAGVFAAGAFGFLALAVVAVFMAWLLFIAWPHLPVTGRVVRVAATAVVIGFALSRLT